MKIFVKACKKEIIDKFGKQHRIFFLIHMLERLFRKYAMSKSSWVNEDGHIIFKPELFGTHTAWDRFYKQYKSNDKLFISSKAEPEKLIANVILSDLFKNHLDNYIFESQAFLSNTIREVENNEELDVQNIYSINKYNSLHPHDPIKHIEDDYTYYVPNNILSFDNLHILFNKEQLKFKFLVNPSIELSHEFSFGINEVKKYRIEIVDDPIESTNERFITKYKFRCPRCYRTQELLPAEIHTNLKHDCGFDDRGISVKSSALEPYKSEQMYIYEARLVDDDTKLYIHSFDNNLKRARYIVDICMGFNYVKNAKDSQAIYLALGVEQQRPALDKSLITDSDAREWCEKNDYPYIKMLDALFSARRLYKKYTSMNIKDQGMLLQIFATMSSLNKLLFNHNKFAINVIGSTSLGKTYIGYFVGILFDTRFKFISNTRNVTLAGLVGGVDMKKSINGRELTWFEKGIISRAGITLFDEGKQFFIDPDLNDTLKDFPSRYINIEKIKKANVENLYTPWIFSNLNEHHQLYREEIYKYYPKFVHKAKEFKNHAKDRQSCLNYVMSLNLYLPLEWYKNKLKNEVLLQTIAYVRKTFYAKEIDWKTGGTLPASNRLLFDVISYHPEEMLSHSDKIIMDAEQFTTVLQDDVPVEEFTQAIKDYYGCEDIDLLYIHENTDEIKEQLNLLKQNVIKWFMSASKHGGKDVHHHLSEHKQRMDPKLESLSVTLAMSLQLMQDPTSTELCLEVKKWLRMILMKTKRGVTKKEYDFKDHNFVPEQVNIDVERLSYDVKMLEEEERLEKTIEIERKLMEMKVDEDEEKGLNIKELLLKAGFKTLDDVRQ